MGTTPRLPLVTLYLTERCNSRCVTCDYWRVGRDHMTRATVERMLPGLAQLGTSVALLSGGEPLLNPQWRDIAALLRAHDIRLWLLTSGLSLAKHAAQVEPLFESVTVSLDGTNPATYRAIRGLDAFDTVCDGIRAAVASGVTVTLRVTVQQANYRELPEFVTLAQALGVRSISFLAVDVSNSHAFARAAAPQFPLALAREDLAVFGELLSQFEVRFAREFARGFIAESPAKLRRMHAYFSALQGLGEFPPVRCNAPEFSAVVGVHGALSPCFFISGPADALAGDDPGAALDGDSMRELRAQIQAGARAECARCVCSLWREMGARTAPHLLPGVAHA